jgi:malonyl CoA-acyl carrier protein transacylase
VKDGGVTKLVELGSGKVLSGLAKRIAPETAAVPIGTSAPMTSMPSWLSFRLKHLIQAINA